MSDDVEWDQDWWKKKRDASLERRQVESVSASGISLGDTFLIVTEGTVTEPVYFECFLATLELSRVSVKVIPGKAPDPRHVINTGRSLADGQIKRWKEGQAGIREPAKYDHVWAVIDTDVAVREGFWNDVKQLADSQNVQIAHSTPCFEFWLLLHVSGYTTRGDLRDGDAAKAAVKAALGEDYSTDEKTARKAIASFVGNWPQAVINAEKVRKHHLDAATKSPANPSTEVDRLARALNDSAPVHQRMLT
jgi:hypothetical protein